MKQNQDKSFESNDGTIFRTPDNKNPMAGTQVTIVKDGQTHGGTYTGGGQVQKNN